ncbi:MAG: heme-binding protein [Planctomycetota bacterium]
MKNHRPFTSLATAAVLSATAPGFAEAESGTSAMPEPREVYIEANLPEGFPAPGPAYEVLLKEYPVYRGARAEGGNAFRKLFNHIQSHDIAMTTPVEMTLAPNAADAAEDDNQATRDRDGFYRMDMLFMYERPDMGELGPDETARPGEDVEVVELPPMQVLSLGFFGNADRQTINDALAMVERHLAKRDDLVAVGPPRLMGYNSPMVPARNRYSEVQIPVGPAEDAEAQTEDATANAAVESESAAVESAD